MRPLLLRRCRCGSDDHFRCSCLLRHARWLHGSFVVGSSRCRHHLLGHAHWHDQRQPHGETSPFSPLPSPYPPLSLAGGGRGRPPLCASVSVVANRDGAAARSAVAWPPHRAGLLYLALSTFPLRPCPTQCLRSSGFQHHRPLLKEPRWFVPRSPTAPRPSSRLGRLQPVLVRALLTSFQPFIWGEVPVVPDALSSL